MLSNITFHDIQQNTEEWDELRKCRTTSSHAAEIMAHYPGKFGDPAIRYARKKALERVTGKLDLTETFKNKWMDRGHEFEPIALEIYEKEYLCDVKNGGFFCNEKTGDSPDGVIGNDGRLEIKCVGQQAHWDLLCKGGYDLKYKWQIQRHIMFGAEWCDFVSYCPEFPESKRLYVYTVQKDEEMIDSLFIRYAQFEKLIKEFEEKLLS